jgi:amino-acid N-acetyltransferase
MHHGIRRATEKDVNAIHELLQPYSDTGIILERTRHEIRRSINTFYVAEEGKELVGAVSYCDYGPRLKEVRSLAVKTGRFRRGTGSNLLEFLLRALIELYPGTRIFVLTYSPEFFRRHRFQEVPKDSLPEKIWKDCNHCINRESCGETAMMYANLEGQ